MNEIEKRFNEKFGTNPIFARRWALNCAVAIHARAEVVSTEGVLEVAKQFENYLLTGETKTEE